MIGDYGHTDGSGNFRFRIDTDKCDACGACVTACPNGVFALEEYFDDVALEDKKVAIISEEHRNNIKYVCAPCHPTGGDPTYFCVDACKPGAIEPIYELK